ncbi:hypothetical protein GCM10023224_05590 [Streptomonospora halophila]|uniref:Homeodomain-like domain-containing protein n=1 Tax=Streptomonospora halophila TaxID=427369 RepID=A0ABP9GC35_9ACTN
MGITRTRRNQLIWQVAALATQSYSDVAIAEHLGINRDTVARYRRATQPDQEDRPIPHGTPGGYTHHGCRCDPCTAANRENCRRTRAARKETP